MVQISPLINAVYHDEAFNAEIKGYLEKFYDVATETIRRYLTTENIRAYVLDKIKGNAGDHLEIMNEASSSNKFNMQSIYFTVLEGVGISVEKREAIQREKRLVAALWVILLECFKNEINTNDLKYPTLESFLHVYKNYGDNISTIAQESEKEKKCLWHTANWMTILLSMVPARKSKDLAIQVVPKLIEGWDVRYITGSGQKRSTAYRVAIFEKEGNVSPRERKKMQKVQSESAVPSSVANTSVHTHEVSDQQTAVPSIPPQPTNQIFISQQQQQQLQLHQYQIFQQMQQLQQLQQLQQMQQMAGIISGQYQYPASLNKLMGGAGSEGAVHVNPLMAAGGIDFRFNPELMNLWMNHSAFMPGCTLPSGSSLDFANMNRFPMHLNLPAKLNGMYGSAVAPLLGATYSNSDMTSIAALSNAQFGRGWSPNQLPEGLNISMAELAASSRINQSVHPQLQREQSWSGELLTIRSNWDESAGTVALGASSVTSAPALSGLDTSSTMPSQIDPRKVAEENLLPKSVVNHTEGNTATSCDDPDPSSEILLEEKSKPADDEFQCVEEVPSMPIKAIPSDEIPKDSASSGCGLSKTNTITLDNVIAPKDSTGLTRLNSLNSLNGILREYSWSSQCSNIDAILSQFSEEVMNMSKVNSEKREFLVDAWSKASDTSMTANESKKRKDPSDDQPAEQALKNIRKSSKGVPTLCPSIPREVTMGLGFNFSQGIPRDTSWSNSDTALSQELKDIDSTSSGRSFDILAAVASAISSNDTPNSTSSASTINSTSIPMKKGSIPPAADTAIRLSGNTQDDTSTSSSQIPIKIKSDEEKTGILGENRLRSLFGNFK